MNKIEDILRLKEVRVNYCIEILATGITLHTSVQLVQEKSKIGGNTSVIGNSAL
jgi:hypothetical protein